MKNTDAVANSDYKYSEIGIALENFNYNTNVKFNIPSLMTFLNNSDIITKTSKLKTSNIANKNELSLGIGNCTTCNYVDIFVPSSSNIGTPIYDADGVKIFDGTKGDKCMLIFVGGNINLINILGKFY